MKVKNILLSLGLVSTIGLNSCEDYLDKSPDSEVREETVFQDFNNFQGFVEDNYMAIPNKTIDYWTTSWNWGEDEILNAGCTYHYCYMLDQGNFWGWQHEFDGWSAGWMDEGGWSIDKTRDNNGNGARYNAGLWPAAWYCIRKCNLGIQKIEEGALSNATNAEKEALLGQMYFFRAWWHFQLIQYFGGLPYIDKVLESSSLNMPRETYDACAEKIDKDLELAYKYLPQDWDKSSVGSRTQGNNQFRVNKIHALAYKGKNLLWAASPLMNQLRGEGESYNKEYAKRAAEEFGKLLKEVEETGQYKLVDFSEYETLCRTDNHQSTGGTETIFRGSAIEIWHGTAWGVAKQFYPGLLGSNSEVRSWPTANYVDYFGMKNGLPITDDDSQFDKTQPYKDRDPRFYKDIAYDGCDMKVTSDKADYQAYSYCTLSSDGFMRGKSSVNAGGKDITVPADRECRTGYINIKIVSPDWNEGAKNFPWNACGIHVSWLRLADVYLMYAEAQAVAEGANTKASTYTKTAIEALNVVRERAGVDPLNSKYYEVESDIFNGKGFLSELRRERAVELAWEGHRFNDLRRWLLLDKAPYTKKQKVEFTRAESIDPSAKGYDPSTLKVNDFRNEDILTRKFSAKHYWLPLKKSDCLIYPEFKQNPGW